MLTFHALAEVWAAGKPFTVCRVEIDRTYQPTPTDLAAVTLYQKFVPSETTTGALDTMLSICAMTGASQEDILRWQPTVVKGALTLCPDAPQAGLMGPWANGQLIEDGSHVVGQDMVPGRWQTEPGVQDCYWERTTGGGSTIANNFVSFAPNGVTVTVYASDGGFVTQGCGYWHKIG